MHAYNVIYARGKSPTLISPNEQNSAQNREGTDGPKEARAEHVGNTFETQNYRKLILA